ncbi:LCP family protein [Dermacoccaceae bacterium W4C1]
MRSSRPQRSAPQQRVTPAQSPDAQASDGFDTGYGPDRTQQLPVGRPGRRQGAAQQAGYNQPGSGYDDPRYGSGGPGGNGGNGGPSGPGRAGPEPDGAAEPARPRKRRRFRKFLVIFLVLLLVWVGLIAWAGKSAWDNVEKVDAIPTSDRPAAGKGTNVVLVGSDSREGLSAEQRKELGTGSAAGRRTDSIMVLHIPDSGDPTLVSLPRDSYVDIPGRGKGKINSSFAHGGPKLLVQTVEQATGLRIDRYLEIGFGGFASVVDSVGGVEMCLPKAMKDEKAHIDLPAGCQNLDGKNALGYVRARYSDPLGDLGRAQRQREFLGALMKKMASPANVLNPFKLRSMGTSGAQGVSVNEGMSPWQALTTMLALRKISSGSGQSVQVPVSDTSYRGSFVLWNADKAKALFDDLNADKSPNVEP